MDKVTKKVELTETVNNILELLAQNLGMDAEEFLSYKLTQLAEIELERIEDQMFWEGMDIEELDLDEE